MVNLVKVTCVHPKMVRKEDFKAEIHAAITRHAPPDNPILIQWYADNRYKLDGTGEKVPSFHLGVTTERFGNREERVKVTTFNILCTQKDGLYLKTVMAVAWMKEEKPCGVFVPARVELITSPMIYK
eukprot:12022946-Ditylum_brightwellii.AAC.1